MGLMAAQKISHQGWKEKLQVVLTQNWLMTWDVSLEEHCWNSSKEKGSKKKRL